MEKKLVLTLGAIVIVILFALALFVVYRAPASENNTNDISSSATAAIATQCLEPVRAYQKINSGACVPVYESPDCFASGKVEIRC